VIQLVDHQALAGLGAAAALEFAPSGLICRMSAALADEEGAPAAQ
jgi:hypothetical protein